MANAPQGEKSDVAEVLNVPEDGAEGAEHDDDAECPGDPPGQHSIFGEPSHQRQIDDGAHG
jgi:hypothetical protein